MAVLLQVASKICLFAHKSQPWNATVANVSRAKVHILALHCQVPSQTNLGTAHTFAAERTRNQMESVQSCHSRMPAAVHDRACMGRHRYCAVRPLSHNNCAGAICDLLSRRTYVCRI